MANLRPNDSFEKIKFVEELRKTDSPFLNGLQEVYEIAEELMAHRTPAIFGNYTLHNIKHSVRVANYMYDMVAHKLPNKDKVGELDIVIMLYAAILHDIGMVVYDEEVEGIKTDKFLDSDGKIYKTQLAGINNIDWIKAIADEHEKEALALQEFVRRTHGYRSHKFIDKLQKENKGFFGIPDFPSATFHEELGLICESHNETYDWVKNNLKPVQTKGEYTYSPQFCAVMLRVADILEIDERRTPPILFESINPQGRSMEEWLQHRVIQNAQKVHWDGQRMKFKFEGECDNAKIHRKIYHYLDWVKDEVVGMKGLIRTLPEDYYIDIDTEIIRDITPKGNYTIPDNRMSIDFRAVSTLLMGEQIYGDKKYGLRELLQNAMDACRLRTEVEEKHKRVGDDAYQPTIKIILDKENNEVRIKDNGMGMDEYIIHNHFLSIGKSYYKSDSFKINNYDYQPIGGFGIGFLACYMLSNKVKVRTRHRDCNTLYEIELEQGDEYSCINEIGNSNEVGTEVILQYDEVLDVFTEEDNIKEFIEENILTGEIKFEYWNSIKRECINTSTNNKINKESNGVHCCLSDYLNNNLDVHITLNSKKKIVFRNIRDLRDLRSFAKLVLFYEENSITENLDINVSSLLKNNVLNFYTYGTTSSLFPNSDFSSLNVEVIYDNNKYEHKDEFKQHVLSCLEQYRGENPKKISFLEIIKKKFYRAEYAKKATLKECFTNTFSNGEYIIPYMPYNTQFKNDIIDRSYMNVGDWIYGGFGDDDDIYNNYVLINSNMLYDVFNPLGCNQTSLSLDNCKVNIIEPIQLNVSRNDFANIEDKEELSYAIYKAAHIAAVDVCELNEDEKALLRSFIKEHFAKKTRYCKDLPF